MRFIVSIRDRHVHSTPTDRWFSQPQRTPLGVPMVPLSFTSTSTSTRSNAPLWFPLPSVIYTSTHTQCIITCCCTGSWKRPHFALSVSNNTACHTHSVVLRLAPHPLVDQFMALSNGNLITGKCEVSYSIAQELSTESVTCQFVFTTEGAPPRKHVM